jgi:hypothetical protein
MIFSPSTGATNKWVVLKPYLIFFSVLGAGKRSGLSPFIINYAWCNEPITIPLDGGHVMFLLYEIISGKTK